MALLRCPECSQEVSDRAAICVHCGCPLENVHTSAQLYAVVLRSADYNDAQIITRIATIAGVTEEKATVMKQKVPVVLKQGLLYDDCMSLIGQFTTNSELQVIRDEDADNLAAARPVAYSAEPPPKALTFLSVVGAALTALVIWALVSNLLVSLVF